MMDGRLGFPLDHAPQHGIPLRGHSKHVCPNERGSVRIGLKLLYPEDKFGNLFVIEFAFPNKAHIVCWIHNISKHLV